MRPRSRLLDRFGPVAAPAGRSGSAAIHPNGVQTENLRSVDRVSSLRLRSRPSPRHFFNDQAVAEIGTRRARRSLEMPEVNREKVFPPIDPFARQPVRELPTREPAAREEVVYASVAMKQIAAEVRLIAGSAVAVVLVLGESGSGKHLVA